MSKAAPWTVLLFVTLMSSAGFAIIKYMEQFVTPVELLFVIFFPASLLSITLILIFYRRPFMKIFPKAWGYFLAREAFAVLGYHFPLIYAESVLPAGVSAMIIGTWPAVTMFMAWPALGEKITKWKLTGALLAFSGVSLVVLFGAHGEAVKYDIPLWAWIRYSLVLFIAPISAAIVTIVTRWYLTVHENDENQDSFLFSLMCRAPALIYVVFAYYLFPDSVPLMDKLANVPTLFWILAGVISIHNTLFIFWLWNWCIKKLPAANVASFSYIQTAFALAIALVFLNEEINLLKVIGTITILIGVLLANFERWKMDRKIKPSDHAIFS